MVTIKINENEANQRLDKFLKKFMPKASLSLIYKIIRKDLKVNGKRKKQDQVLSEGDLLDFYIDEKDFEALTFKEDKPRAKRQFQIEYEDENIIIVNKPYGLLTHGDKTEKKNTLANQVVSYLIENGDYDPKAEKTFVPSPSNRLDRNTTGLVIFGKNSEAVKTLNKIIADKSAIEKWYEAVVLGKVDQEIHLKDQASKDQTKNQVKITSDCDQGKEMETFVYPEIPGDSISQVKVRIMTGRTHQIRVHLAACGHPIIGDTKYGDLKANKLAKQKYGITAQLLHAEKLKFVNCQGCLEYMNGKIIKAKLPDKRFAQVTKDIKKGK